MNLKVQTIMLATAVTLFAVWAEAQATAPMKPSPVAPPQVTAPVRPSVAAPTTNGAAAASVGKPATTAHAPLIVPAYDEAAFKKAADASAVVIVVFSAVGDAIWDKQATALQAVLREPEFNRTPTYQIDMSNPELAEKFLVKSAGTILVFKGGVERLRSTKMVKGDVIRKMLRLNTTL